MFPSKKITLKLKLLNPYCLQCLQITQWRKLLAHRRTAQEKMGAMTFSEMECDDFDFAGAESVPMEGFGEGR